MKYIIFHSSSGPRCVLFAAPITHSEMAALLRAGGFEPASAGFVEFLGAGKVRTCGRSDSLNLNPGPGDESLIEVFAAGTLRLCPPEEATAT